MTLLLYISIFYSAILTIIITGLCKIGNYKSVFANVSDATQKDEISTISVIIACKNEENNIKQLIHALEKQTLKKDLYEVIIADDGSTDQTANIVKSMIENTKINIKYHLVNPSIHPYIVGKKRALTQAIDISKGQILAFTDADCIPCKDWLLDISFAFKYCDFYTGYSPLISQQSGEVRVIKHIINHLKNLERASIFAVSAGTTGVNIPATCTARNMAYTKELWDVVEGFKGIGHLLSGDDDLMLHKLNIFINKPFFSFNPDAIVPSIDNHEARKQISQETRRASKFIYYPLYIKLFVLLIAMFYGLMTYQIFLSFFNLSYQYDLLIAIVCKLILEFMLLFIFLKRFGKLNYLKTFLIAELLYIPYFLIFGIKGTFGKFKWKS